MTHQHLCEYIWIDGTHPVRSLRSKSRIILSGKGTLSLEDIPEWAFDGSSCSQAIGHDSDCLLRAVHIVPDPLRGEPHYLALCEVFNPDGSPHVTNTRFLLRHILEAAGPDIHPWFGFEQEYTLFQNGRPLGWPADGTPRPQGPYYCGVGSAQALGRPLAEDHARACLEAGLLYYGLNAEVMPSQWEFQIGYRGDPGEDLRALRTADDLWIARWLLHRLSEEYAIHVSFENKPMKGDWNGAGLHTNYSTALSRTPTQGLQAITAYVDRLERHHQAHIALYGDKLEERLTGHHETCSIHEFRHGTADRGSSVRIPRPVALAGYGYLEDRRPGANADPYLVAARILATTLDLDASALTSLGHQPCFEVA